MKAKLKAKKTLSKFTDRELCNIYERLNNWEWDNRLGEMPENFNHLPNTKGTNVRSKDKYIKPYMVEIRKRVPVHDLLKYHHLYNLLRTEEEFERWWEEEAKHYLVTEKEGSCWVAVVLASVLASVVSILLK